MKISLLNTHKSLNGIERIVTQILNEKKTSGNANTNDLEVELDSIIYELFFLTEEEPRIVEGG